MAMLSGKMRLDVMQQMTSKLVSSVAFLADKSSEFVFEFSNGLVRQTNIHADSILTEGEHCLRQIW
jgi:hypothetical protein